MSKGNYALIAVSPFNSYFSINNMKKLFNWADINFIDFNVFMMDEVSVYNLMAIGYDKKKLYKKQKSMIII